jgi:hypothetical protein
MYAYNNTIDACTVGVRVANGVDNFTIINNLITNTATPIYFENSGNNNPSLVHHNLLGVNPLYVNAAAFDYRLVSGSPAVDSGAVPNFSQAFYDSFHDIYEALNSPEALNLHLDYRSQPRPVEGDGDGLAEWDIGAFERIASD